MEIDNHIVHIAYTYDRMIHLLFNELEASGFYAGIPMRRTRWIKTRDLAVEGVNNERMAITHLLWLQQMGRIIVEDMDPYLGIVRVCVLPVSKETVAGKTYFLH